MKVTDVPSYSALDGTAASLVYGALAREAEPLLEPGYEHSWQRHQALIDAIDDVLAGVAAGTVRDECGAKPRWLDGLVARELGSAATSYWSGERFVRVRLLERLGLVDLEPDDTYVLAMVSGLGPGKPDKLRADPDLIESALRRAFQVEAGGQVT